MQIQLSDSLTRSVKPLPVPEGQHHFGVYCCGPTVYGPAHIGNFRTFLVQDVLHRLLEVLGYSPYFVRNITDVDDKTIRQSQQEGLSLQAFTEQWTKIFHKDCTHLNMLLPHEEPRATAHIEAQVSLIQKLMDKGYAYQGSDGSVYYKVDAFADYGKLNHLDREALQTQSTTSSGSQNQADEYDRECVADFALWKLHKEEDGDNAWESPWGKGRPGWHIECSAMAMQYLGETFDLHGGGVDLCFPHHENEIAQAEAVTGKPFAHHWFHIAHLMVEGQKMSKSLGNLYTLSDILEKNFSVMALRYALIAGHYHQPLNFTFDTLHAASSALEKLDKGVRALLKQASMDEAVFEGLKPDYDDGASLFPGFWARITDDLNVPGALGELFKAINSLKPDTLSSEEATKLLKELATVFYVLGLKVLIDAPTEDVPEAIQLLAQKRWEAKKNKDFAAADSLRQELESQGWKVLDSKDGYTIEAL
tara:strand:- start:29356 stop:30786 length:1431 start_codon:yes stop_codon:yes gene_type:complete